MLDGSETLRETVSHYDWWTIPAAELLAELDASGMAAEPTDAGLVVARRRT